MQLRVYAAESVCGDTMRLREIVCGQAVAREESSNVGQTTPVHVLRLDHDAQLQK